MPFTMRTSIHGRRLGISSTSGIIAGGDGTTPGNGSTIFGLAAQMWGSVMNQSIAIATTLGTTMVNYGITTISSGDGSTVITASELARPEQGVYKEIHIGASASEVSIGSTSTAIVFASTVAVVAASTMFFSRANLAGTVITLRGVSTAEWIVTGSTTSLTIG